MSATSSFVGKAIAQGLREVHEGLHDRPRLGGEQGTRRARPR